MTSSYPTGELAQAALPGVLAPFFNPKTIAVIGASETPGLARDLLMTLDSRGFRGDVLPVNPRHRQVLGRRCYPDVRSLPTVADLAVVLVPAEATPEVVAACGQAKVPGAVICSSGFAEVGEDGRGLQARLGRQARAAGLALLGPNSIGFLNVPATIPAMAVPPASIPAGLRPGPVSVVSQSAGILISMLEYGTQIGLGFDLLVSTGNEEQVGAADCLEYLLHTPTTRVIALVLETARDGRRLLDLAVRARALGKAVVALKLGRSARGAEAARSHTAALAGSAAVFDAACRDAGIEVFESISGLVDAAAFHSKRRPGVRGGLAAITISGGTAALVADVADRFGVRLADLAPQTQQRLMGLVPAGSAVVNPLDVTAAAIEDAELFARVVGALNDDPDVGAIALVLHLRKGGGSPAHQRLIRTFVAQHDRVSKQLVVVSTIPEALSGFWHEEAAAGPVPFLNDLSALAALRGLTASVEPTVKTRRENPPDVPEVSLDALKTPVTGDGLLAEVDAYRLLEAAGIAVAPYLVARSREEAVAGADRLGYPVVLKVIAGVAHKAAAGLVRLGLRSADDVARAYDELGLVPLPSAAARRGVLVQAMVAPGMEFLVGFRVDPQFGPVVAVGLGGVWAEALRDVQIALAPVDPRQALALIGRLRSGHALQERAVQAKVDLDDVAEVTSRLSHLAVRLASRVSSLEINPLIATPRGCLAVDALGVVSGVRDCPTTVDVAAARTGGR
ncbi:MAG: acetate--CoA ligase family protein [Armatimonadota bacterium]|nr:acetate--CoA ligase family protein [Armatimonadota bacterium]